MAQGCAAGGGRGGALEAARQLEHDDYQAHLPRVNVKCLTSHVTRHTSHMLTVIRVTPPNTAAAPTMAYIPGVMQRLVCVQDEKKPVSPTSL